MSRLNLAALVALLVSALSACTPDQGEGERCNRLNGNDDCTSGLICVEKPGIAGQICCPSQVALATVKECKNELTQTPDSAVTPIGDSVTSDGSADVNETTVDSSSQPDSPADSPAEVLDTSLDSASAETTPDAAAPDSNSAEATADSAPESSVDSGGDSSQDAPLDT